MTDQPHDEPQPGTPPESGAPAAGTPETRTPEAGTPEPAMDAAPPAPAGPPPSGPAPVTPGEPYAAGPGQPPPPPNPYAPPAAAAPYGPPPPANPYGGPVAAPTYDGGRAMHPGSIGYVEQNFGRVADFGQRVLALLIDTAISLIGLIPMIIGIVVLVAAAPTTTTYDQFGNSTLTGGNTSLAVVGGLLIAFGVLLAIGISLWNRVFRMGRTGQSVGKSIIGLKLIDDKTGQPIGAWMAFLREIVQSIVNQVFYLGYLWMLWDTDKQTVGDKAVHSTVVVLPKA